MHFCLQYETFYVVILSQTTNKFAPTLHRRPVSLPVSLPLCGCLSPSLRLRMRAAPQYFRVVCRCEDSVGTPQRVSPVGKLGSGLKDAPGSPLLSPRSSGSRLRVSAAAEAAFRSLRPVERSADHRRVRSVFVVPDGHFRSELHNKSLDCPGELTQQLESCGTDSE